MPKRPNLKTIGILGAGSIFIGQACAFAYFGVQVCKAWREGWLNLV